MNEEVKNVMTEVMENGVEVTHLLPETKSHSGRWIAGTAIGSGLAGALLVWGISKLAKKAKKKKEMKALEAVAEDVNEEDNTSNEEDDNK